MNVQVTIGVTPELGKLLEGLTQLVNVSAPIQTAPIQTPEANQTAAWAPPQEVFPQQQAPIQQQAPTAAPVQEQTPPPIQQAPPTAVPTAATSYTMEQLAVAATQLMDAGKRDELLGLLGTFGIQALTALPKEQYGTFATKLREKGAKI